MIGSMESVIDPMTSQSPRIEASGPIGLEDGARGSDRPAIVVRRVLLATDVSSASEAAAREAIRLASEARAQLVVLSVIDPGRLRLPGGLFLRRVDQERARIESAAQVLVARARAAGVRATFLVWEGDPAEAILAAAEAENVDLIVIGSHGRGPLGRFVLGSTSASVSEHARRRVLVVPA
jgi:nucleotide-binding universal stress UspA family protein